MIETDRLLLRNWRIEDKEAFFRINSDRRVMEFFPRLPTRDESDSFVDRNQALIESRGYGLWAVVEKRTRTLAGFVGLAVPRFEAHFTPCVEIGWRLGFDHWGHGFASEAARSVLRFGFERLQLEEIVSFTSVVNVRSVRVMQRLGMTHDPSDDFDHPNIASTDPLCRHVLYRLSNQQWLNQQHGAK